MVRSPAGGVRTLGNYCRTRRLSGFRELGIAQVRPRPNVTFVAGTIIPVGVTATDIDVRDGVRPC
jgi:hypothetical protein